LADHFLNYPQPCFVNLGTGVDVSIGELAEMIKDVVGFRGKLRFDSSKPDGTLRKLQDVLRMKELGWVAQVGLRQGIEKTYQWFLQQGDTYRR
jgi:GDP-L-fucose synthase